MIVQCRVKVPIPPFLTEMFGEDEMLELPVMLGSCLDHGQFPEIKVKQIFFRTHSCHTLKTQILTYISKIQTYPSEKIAPTVYKVISR
jgi:hypothetical protein